MNISSSVLKASVVLAVALAGCYCPSEERTAPATPKEGSAPTMPKEDIIKTSAGELKITFVGHGTLMFTFADTVIHVDPTSREADYAKMPKADVVLVTHHHGDHFDPTALLAVWRRGTAFVLTEKCAETITNGIVMKNGDVRTISGIKIEAVPAYNIVHERSPGVPFHPKGVGNGYVITFGDKRVYVAGDTENIPEMKALERIEPESLPIIFMPAARGIDIAFLPMNLPYTMTPEMVADAAKTFRPMILYPYHTGKTDISKLVKLLAGEDDIEVRIREMQ